MKEYAKEQGAEPDEMKDRLMAYRAELDGVDAKPWPHAFLSQWPKLKPRLISYPGEGRAYALMGYKANEPRQGSGPVPLDKHLADVDTAVERIAAGLHKTLIQPLKAAAKFHDSGKIDVRYQAWLLGGDLMAARYAPKPIAKSGNDLVGKQETVGLPKGFRHELLSLMFAERSADFQGEARDLVLHLVASHHGRCRPFAPVILDEKADCISYGGISICREERIENTPHRLDGKVADRFWSLTRKYGWWGLAHLEALLRLADWNASEQENAEVFE